MREMFKKLIFFKSANIHYDSWYDFEKGESKVCFADSKK